VPGRPSTLAERGDRLARVQEEIRRAQAEALGRAGERLQALLDRVADWDRRLDDALRTLGGPATDGQRLLHGLADRNRLRDEAARASLHLVIQREALGLARHGAVERCYPVPDRRRLPGAPGDGDQGGGRP
jgi:hypothetical protein